MGLKVVAFMAISLILKISVCRILARLFWSQEMKHIFGGGGQKLGPFRWGRAETMDLPLCS